MSPRMLEYLANVALQLAIPLVLPVVLARLGYLKPGHWLALAGACAGVIAVAMAISPCFAPAGTDLEAAFKVWLASPWSTAGGYCLPAMFGCFLAVLISDRMHPVPARTRAITTSASRP